MSAEDEKQVPVHDQTMILAEHANEAGERAAGRISDRLFPLVYEELRRRACALMRQERAGHTLQATAVVHEAYLKLVDRTRIDWRGRSHFLAVAALAMKRVLIDHARGKRRSKRGGDQFRVTLAEVPCCGRSDGTLDAEQLIALKRAIDKLAGLDPRQGRIVELRFFGGLTGEEIAHVVGVSRRTVQGEWTHAKAWLRHELAADERPSFPIDG